MKYILVSGGVISGIGKGVIGSSQLASIASPDASR
jgi:CTP synthase (UTP-ammonia lyase)